MVNTEPKTLNNVLVEVCCGSAEDAIQAARGGAPRAELCSNLFQGGLTPTLGSFETVREACDIRLMVMLRPREGGFLYTDSEYRSLLNDARHFIKAGADGLVCGFLHEDGSIDLERTREIVEMAEGLPVTFHRAFDVTPDWRQAIDQLAEIGVKRILTSGQQPNVLLALDEIREMIDYAGDRIIIMPGAGITPETAAKVAELTGCREMHVHFTRTLRDPSCGNNRGIFYGGALYPSEFEYPVIDHEKVSSIIR